MGSANRWQPVGRRRKINGRIPRDLETICLKAMAKDRRVRFADCREMGDDLLANRALSQIYRSGQYRQLYSKWFERGGARLKPSPILVAMYKVQAMPE